VTTVRRATPADARDIADVKVETWRAAYVGVVPQALLDAMDIDEHTQQWEQWLSSASNAVFVAEQDAAVVGFVSVGPCDDLHDVGELYAIYVRPAAWGGGAGPALIEAGVDWLSARWPEAILWVARENPRARRFYERHGWVPDGERVDEVLGTEVPELRYRLSGLGQR
jgi:RimJ/RimL family protein N-acetyltransferase